MDSDQLNYNDSASSGLFNKSIDIDSLSECSEAGSVEELFDFEKSNIPFKNKLSLLSESFNGMFDFSKSNNSSAEPTSLHSDKESNSLLLLKNSENTETLVDAENLIFNDSYQFVSQIHGQVDILVWNKNLIESISKEKDINQLLASNPSRYTFNELQSILDLFTSQIETFSPEWTEQKLENMHRILLDIKPIMYWMKIVLTIISNRWGEFKVIFKGESKVGLTSFKKIINAAVEVCLNCYRMLKKKEINSSSNIECILLSCILGIISLEIAYDFDLKDDCLSIKIGETFGSFITYIYESKLKMTSTYQDRSKLDLDKVMTQFTNLQVVCFANSLIVSSSLSPLCGHLNRPVSVSANDDSTRLSREIDVNFNEVDKIALQQLCSTSNPIRNYLLSSISFYLHHHHSNNLKKDEISSLLPPPPPTSASSELLDTINICTNNVSDFLSICMESVLSVYIYHSNLNTEGGEGKGGGGGSNKINFEECGFQGPPYINNFFLSLLSTLQENITTLKIFWPCIQEIRMSLLGKLRLFDEQLKTRDHYITKCIQHGSYARCCPHLEYVSTCYLESSDTHSYFVSIRDLARCYSSMGDYDTAIAVLIKSNSNLIKISTHTDELVSSDIFKYRMNLNLELVHYYRVSGSTSQACKLLLEMYKETYQTRIVYHACRISILSWLAVLQCDLLNLEEAKKILTVMKDIRSVQEQKNKDSSGQQNNNNKRDTATTLDLASSLTKCCITSHDADFGEIKAKIYLQSKLFVSALKSLTPTIISVALAANVSNPHSEASSSSSSFTELARLYVLRGSIQVEAAKSGRKLRFPFIIGSSLLFDAIKQMFDNEYIKEEEDDDRDAKDVEDDIPCTTDKKRASFFSRNKSNSRTTTTTTTTATTSLPDTDSKLSVNFLAIKHSKKYMNPADLLWDAKNWYIRALNIYNHMGDFVSASRTAQLIVSLYLEATFLPTVFLRVPLSKSCDLGGGDGRGTTTATATAAAAAAAAAAASVLSSSVYKCDPQNVKKLPKLLSLDDALKFNDYSLQIIQSIPSPIPIINAYLNLAEIKFLQGHQKEANLYWLEAKDMFYELFVNGTDFPILYQAPLTYLTQFQMVIKRLVRLLWSFDKEFVNKNILMMDIYISFTIEYSRFLEYHQRMANNISIALTSVLANPQETKPFAFDALLNQVEHFKKIRKFLPTDYSSLNSKSNEPQENIHSLDNNSEEIKKIKLFRAKLFAAFDGKLCTLNNYKFWFPWVNFTEEKNKISNFEGNLNKNSWRCHFILEYLQNTYEYDNAHTRLELKSKYFFRVINILSSSMNSIRVMKAKYCTETINFDSIYEKFVHSRPGNFSGLKFDDLSSRSTDIITRSVHGAEWLEHMVYVLQIDDAILFYNPFSGEKHHLFLTNYSFPSYAESIEICKSLSSISETETAAEEEEEKVSNSTSTSSTKKKAKSKKFVIDKNPGHQQIDFDEMIHLMYKFTTEETDDKCLGAVGRKELINNYRRGYLSETIDYLQKISLIGDIEGSAEEVTSVGSVTSVVKSISTTLKSFVPSQIIKLFRNVRSLDSPPVVPPPVVLLCTKDVHVIPWEMLATEINFTREMGLLSWYSNLLANKKEICSPLLGSLPVYIGFAFQADNLSLKMLNDIKSMETKSKTKAVIRSTTGISSSAALAITKSTKSMLQQTIAIEDSLPKRYETLNKSSNSFFKSKSSSFSNFGKDQKHASSLSVLSDDYNKQILKYFLDCKSPYTSNIIPFGKTNGSTLRSNRLKRLQFFDLSNLVFDKPAGPKGKKNNSYSQRFPFTDNKSSSSEYKLNSAASSDRGESILSWVHNTCLTAKSTRGLLQTAVLKYFPVMFFSYSDLVDLSDIVLSVFMNRGETICIFVPQFCSSEVVKEIIGALDHWVTENSDIKTPGYYENTQCQLLKSTWSYHVILDTVSKLQDKMNIAIIVYI